MNRHKQHFVLLGLLFSVILKAGSTNIFPNILNETIFNNDLEPNFKSNSISVDTFGRPPGLTCETATFLCPKDFPYSYVLPTANLFNHPSGCGAIENYQFIQFEAATTDINFNVLATKCVGIEGIQIRLYETSDCNTFNIKYCGFSAIAPDNPNEVVEFKDLTVGNRYYIMIDGYRGDICEYKLSIVSGAVGGKPNIPTSLISGLNSVCKNTNGVTYSIPNQDGVTSYQWKTGSNGSITSGQNTTSVNVNWGTASDSVCVKVVGICGESDWACKKVSMLDVTPTASKSGDLTCSTTSVTLTGSATISPSNAAISYTWLNASNTEIGSSAIISVSQAGTYTLKVRATLDGNFCEKTTTISVTNGAAVPNRPELQGDVITCSGKPLNYNIINAQSGISKYNWVITNGAINSGATTPSVSVTWNNFSTGKICVNAENNCGLSDTTCLNININKIPDEPTITGNASVCPSSVATYTISAPVNGVSYQWTVPTGASIQNGQGTSSININWGSSTGGNICVTPSNSCGTGTNKCFNVIVRNAAPDSIPIQGTKTVCPSETVTYSVAANASITQYTWIVPTNVSILSGQGTPSVSIRFNSGTEATIALNLKNSCNLFTNVSTLVTIQASLPPVLAILGNSTVCSNETTTFSVAGNSAITNYKWSVPSGAQIISGQGTQSINVTWGTALNGKIGLELTNSCNLKRTVETGNITIKNADFTKPNITGNNTNCPNTKSTYTVPTDSRYVKFNWSIPANASLLSGQGTNSIEVSWDNTGTGDICVEIENDCQKKVQSCLPIAVKTGIDSLQISGPIEVCAGATVTFNAQKDPDAVSYVWFVPTGSVINSGRGTNVINVTFGNTAGLVTVNPIGGCAADRSSVQVNLKRAPDAPATLIGKSIVCQGETEIYTAAKVTNALRYNWTVPSGAAIIGADSTNEITVKWNNNTGGNISVIAKGECSVSSPKTLAVSVNSLPIPDAGKDDSICGKRYILKGINSAFDKTWSVIERPTNATVTFDDFKTAQSGITVSKSGKYVLKFMEQNNTCSASDTLILFFKDAPQLTLVDDNCVNDGTTYTLKVNINSSSAPFTSSGLSGNIIGNNFTSNPIADGASYNLVIKDASGCTSDTLKGKKSCPCYTQPSLLTDKTYTVCYGLNAKIDVQKAAILDANDASEFVLHTGSTKIINGILQRNTTGDFTFDASKMQYGTTYFIHQISGNVINNEISTTDRCYSISNGVSIIFKDKITVGLVGDTTICSNTFATLSFKTSDKGTFKISYQNQNQISELNNLKNFSTVRVITTTPSTYKIIDATDENGCKAAITDSAKVTIRPLPIINAGIDRTVCQNTTTLEGVVPPQYKTTWRSISGAVLVDNSNPITSVNNLKNGQNIFVLSVKDNFCTNYQSIDSVSIFLPLIPKAINLSLEMTAGDTLTAKVVEEAPAGTFSVTRIDNPVEGHFELFSNGQFSYIANPNYSGIVRFRFMICSDACTGLCDTGEVRILIKPKKIIPQDVEIIVPNAITPNDDGKNDFLMIDNLDKYPKNELIIFNRWGDILYKSKNYNNDWNGTNQSGEPLPEGTYYYVLRLSLNDAQILRGDLTILR